MITRSRVHEILKTALVGDVSVGVFIAAGLLATWVLGHFPNEYVTWRGFVFALPASLLAIVISKAFTRAQIRWRPLRLAFWAEGKAAAWVAGSLVYAILNFLVLTSPFIGWLVFSLSGMSAALAFIWAVRRFDRLLNGRMSIRWAR